MRARFPVYFLALLNFFCFAASGHDAATVEFSIDKPPLAGAVGTCEYSPTSAEKAFYDRLSEADRSTFDGDLGGKQTFKLSGHEGKFVSWLGIVREINQEPDGLHLLIQNTYFEGLTDCHTQTVEIYGAGDFEINLSQAPDELIPLVLVRVYGVVTEKHENRPVVTADYLRVWHFGQFNFMDFGNDHSNPKWRKSIRLPRGDKMIYHIGVSPQYYADRLGGTHEQWEQIAAFHRGQTDLEFEPEGFPPFEPSADYKPTEWEQRYFDYLRKEDRITVQSNPQEIEHAKFQLTGHLRQFVSWFGIVREVTPKGLAQRGGTLLIENKYFKGSGDEKLQTVSLRGGGDFNAEVTNLSEELIPPMLVRIYGTVVREENGLPVIAVSHLRGWHIGQFNFADYGEDHSNPRWTKNVRLAQGDSVHETELSADYYIKRLGTNDDQSKKITEHFKWVKQWEEEQKKEQHELDKDASKKTETKP
jgi:hypothetical protein